MTSRAPLAARKRDVARERIVVAARELFAEHGFHAVSVADIADRAEVGRTTFFRYFGDKQEVVFAEEQAQVAMIAAAHREGDVAAPRDATEAISQLRDILQALNVHATRDPVGYNRHHALIDEHVELQAREALKLQNFAGLLADIVRERGADEPTALFASQVALACYQTARGRRAGTPQSLVADTEAAFDRVLSLGSHAGERLR